MRKTTFSLIIFIAAAILILQSCYPGDEITAEDTDIVATFFDKEADFSTKTTFAMPDEIIRLDDEGNPINDPGANDQLAMNRIKSNLEDAGFTEITDPDSLTNIPDVLVIAFANQTTWVSGGCYSSWYSWYYPYYGWCYPVYYTYDIGSLVIVMIDVKATEQKTALWVAALNGILEDTNAGIADRLTDGIDQAFTQSPYLNK